MGTGVIDLTWKTFGRLTVLRRDGNSTAGQAKWLCQCRCGTVKSVVSQALRTGHTVSCGCHRNEIASGRERTHGECTNRTAEYRCWSNMIRRCSETADDDDRRNYFDRGVRVCARWRASYQDFLADMGRRPSSHHSIDRIDNNGIYEPGNCRWAVLAVQSVNKRTNRIVEYRGRQMAFKRAWEESERVVGYGTAHNRFWRHNWSAVEAIDTPPVPVAGKRKAGSFHRDSRLCL